MEKVKKKTNKGFTLIETLIGILLTALASSSLFFGVTQATLYLESIRVKEKAHQELQQYTENIKAMVSSGVESFGQDPPQGIDVILKADSKGTPVLKGKLHKEVRKARKSGDYSIYYYIHTYLVWQDKGRFFFNKNTDRDNLDTLEFTTYQVRFNL